MKVEGIIFDLDGTLLDSMKIWDNVGNDYLLSHGITPRENLTETFKEMSLKQSAKYYQSEYGINKSVEEIIAGVEKIVEQFYLNKAQLKEGVKEVLEILYQKDIKMCIATAIDRYLVENALKRLEIREYFEDIITCNEIGYGKDEAEFFEIALKRLSTEKENTIVCEDALYAIITAKKAGFFVVGVYDEVEKNQLEVQKNSDYYLKSFKNKKLISRWLET